MEQTQSPDAGLHVLDYWRVIRTRKEIILAVMLLVVITGVLYTLSLPKMYRAATRIAVRSDSPDVSVFEREFGGQVYNPFFLRTQYEIIQSRPIMLKVAENLDLATRWGAERREDKQPLPLGDAVALLQNSISVSQFRDTSLIMISATRRSPREAAEIANEVAEVYRNQRLTMRRRELTSGLDAMRSELVKQRERVDESERKVDELRRELDVVTTGRGMGAVRVDKIRLSQLEADRISSRVEMIARKTRYDQIKDLKGDELIQTLSFMVGDPEISGIRRELTNTDVQLTVLLQTLGENHPDVLRLKAARGELLKKMEVSLAGVKRGIEATYEESRARYEALDNELNGGPRGGYCRNRRARSAPAEGGA
jgi:polysaccharide biosynthesis transport protein